MLLNLNIFDIVKLGKYLVQSCLDKYVTRDVTPMIR